MTEDDSKVVISAMGGLVGFLLSHIFQRVMKKGEDQDESKLDTAVLETRLDQLEEDHKETKNDLKSHLREHGRHRCDD